MYFYDHKKLIEELKLRKPRSKDNFQYCIAFLTMQALGGVFNSGSSKPVEHTFYIYIANIGFAGISIAIGYYILKALYENNGGDEGNYFLDRILALSWVTTVQVGSIFFPVYLLALTPLEIPLLLDLKVFMSVTIICIGIGGLFYSYNMISSALKEIRRSEQVT